MKRNALFIMMVFVLCTSIMGARAQSLGVKAGILGIGIEGKVGLTRHLGLRAGVNYFPLKIDASSFVPDDSEDVEMDAELNMMSIAGLMDLHPFGTGFRLSAGLLFNSNEFEMIAQPTDDFEIGDETYTAAEVGDFIGTISFNKTNPYLSLGWDTSFNRDKGLGFIFELGAVFHGAPNADFSTNGALADDPELNEELVKEEDKLNEDMESFSILPILIFGLVFKF